MAVAHDIYSEAASYPYASVASYSWSHNPVGTPRGIIVIVYTAGTNGSTKTVTGVTYDGVAMTEITAAAAVDTATELGRVDVFFLGASVPTTDPATVVVSRTNNTTAMGGVCISVTADADTEIYEPGIVLLQENGSYSAQSVDDGSTGIDSMRYCAGYFGGASDPNADTGSTKLNGQDWGAYAFSLARETTAGQGARNVGLTSANDDRAGTHFAVREIVLVSKSRLSLLRGTGGPR